MVGYKNQRNVKKWRIQLRGVLYHKFYVCIHYVLLIHKKKSILYEKKTMRGRA